MSEIDELNRLGATPVKNSGRGKHSKGDGILFDGDEPILTVDIKEYPKGYRITPQNWAKTTTDARQNRTDPALLIAMGEDNPKTRVVVLSEDFFQLLWKRYIEDE